VSEKPQVTEKEFQKARRLYRSFNESDNQGPELFDSAESNTNMEFNKAELEFPDDLDIIKDDLKEIRKNTDDDKIISDNLMQSALNIYIENAMIIAKKNNMLEIGNWDDLEDPFDNHRTRRERELLQAGGLIPSGEGKQRHPNDDLDTPIIQDSGNEGLKMARSKGLLELAEHGKLFDIKMDNVYKSVGDLQVKNFEKYYGIKN
jgi:hypothetical protein